jgi:zinc D-Ala-D-Ala carboxypeptidase
MLRAGAYRRRIEKRIRARNTALPSMAGMTYGRTTYATTRRIRVRRRRAAAVVLVALAAIAVAVAARSPVPSSWTTSSPAKAPAQRAALGQAGGAVPDGTTVFDDGVPGVAKLDPDLLRALRRAAGDAASDGVAALVVNSGWRSPAYEDQLRREAIAKYGSVAEAARWVATGTTSAHVSGDAVDLGPTGATSWLSAHGAVYGLCQIYGNEPWHYELRPEAEADGCPPMYSDPTQDPRMHQ